EDEGALFRQPERCLIAAPSIVKGNEASWKLAAGLDRLQLRLGDVVSVVEARAEPTSAVALHENIDVANVIRLENDSHGRRARVESFPHFSRGGWRSERVEDQPLVP